MTSLNDTLTDAIKSNYAGNDLEELIFAGLSRAGKDVRNLKIADLAPVDEFHIRGRKATLELAQLVAPGPGTHVLDVGCGIGGPSRYLSATYGCRVTGIDLSEEYCRVAGTLTEKVGLSHLITYQQCDARYLPYPDDSFDAVWTQHTAMNIPDKAALYCELYRVLKKNGVLALYDILAGPVIPLYFPVPWARTPDTSFLVTPEQLRLALETAGFVISTWDDTTDTALSWFRHVAGSSGSDIPRPLGLHLLLGNDFATLTQNQLRNLEEQRIVLYQVTAHKTSGANQ